MANVSRAYLIRNLLPRATAVGAMLASGSLRALAQATQPEIIDKHVVIVLDMSGSVSEREAREMQRAWKDEILAHFSRASVTKRNLKYAFTVAHFNEVGVVESSTYHINSLRAADAFVHGVLWDKKKDDFISMKSFVHRGPTRILESLRRAGQIFSGQGIKALSRDVIFTVDGWQVPYHPDDPGAPGYKRSVSPADRKNDRTIIAARTFLEQAFGASVHAITVGDLENQPNPWTGAPFGWGETYGADQEKSIRNLLVTPRGVERQISEQVDGKIYTNQVAVPPGIYRRREQFGPRLREDIGAILSLDRF